MSQLLADTTLQFGVQTARAVEQLFMLMSLPIPDHGDYIKASSQGFIVLLAQTGTLIRIESSSFERVNHPLVLQPLKTLSVDNTLIEICPATALGATDADAESLNYQLLEDGIELDDRRGPNLGIINLPDRTVHVVIDRPAVTYASGMTPDLKQVLEKHGNPQGHFQPLRDAFDHAFAQPGLKAQRRSLQYAQNICRQFKENGLLVCGWENADLNAEHGGVDHKMAMARETARNYAQKMRF